MRKLVGQFLVLTFLIMVIGWGACVIFSLCGMSLTENLILSIPYLLGGLSPTIASYIVQKENGNVRNFKEWLTLTFDFKHNVFSYTLLPVLAGLFFVCLCCISGYDPGAPLFTIIYMIPMMLFGGGLEETGWRGILQPEMEKKYGYTLGTILVAVIWWLWHLPLFFIKGVSQYGADYVAFGVNVVGLSFALAAIKKNTSSTWLCILFHCLINSLHSVYFVGENILGNITAATVMVIFSYIFIWIQNKKHIFL